jgi:hypothetical protein
LFAPTASYGTAAVMSATFVIVEPAVPLPTPATRLSVAVPPAASVGIDQLPVAGV